MSDDHPIAAMMRQLRAHWPEAASPQMRMTILLHRLQELMLDNAQAVLARHGLGLSDYEALSILRCQPEPFLATPGELSDKMMMSSGGVTKLLKGMEARGLVDRPTSAADRRSRPLRLTETGRMLVEAALLDLQDNHQNIFDELPEGMSAETLSDTLIHLTNAAEARRKARLEG
jgi:DNA-binding MarR family transcriptional regulator